MKFNKETLAGAVFVVFRVLLWLPVLAAAAFFGAALGDLLVFFAAEHPVSYTHLTLPTISRV